MITLAFPFSVIFQNTILVNDRCSFVVSPKALMRVIIDEDTAYNFQNNLVEKEEALKDGKGKRRKF